VTPSQVFRWWIMPEAPAVSWFVKYATWIVPAASVKRSERRW